MTCQEFAVIARDYVRSQWLSATERSDARIHLAACQACRDRADAEAQLGNALGALRNEQAELSAPVMVEDAVMAAFDRRRRPVPVAVYWAAPISIAAALLVTVAMWRSPAPSAPPATATVVVEQPAIELPRPVMTPKSAPVAPRARLASNPERVTEFLPLRYGKPVESGELMHVFRMQIRRSELLRLGLPVAPEAASSYVQADVVLGEDGMAKAIRFVY